jgi:hypothetical protein
MARSPRFRVVQKPVPADADQYEELLTLLAHRLWGHPSVQSVVQIGSVATPGISDLDLLVVFRNGSSFPEDPCSDLPPEASKFFIHGLFGCSASMLGQVERFNFFRKYRVLAGDPLAPFLPPSAQETRDIQSQIGLEFLLKFYLILAASQYDGSIRLRDLFLHVKHIATDLDYLQLEAPSLRAHLSEMMTWREVWFKSPPSDSEIRNWVEEATDLLGTTLQTHLSQAPLLSEVDPIRIGRAMRLTSGRWGLSRTGMDPTFGALPASRLARGVRNRFRTTVLSLPIQTSDFPAGIQARFRFLRSTGEEVRRCFPHFLPPAMGLDLTRSAKLK